MLCIYHFLIKRKKLFKEPNALSITELKTNDNELICLVLVFAQFSFNKNDTIYKKMKN